MENSSNEDCSQNYQKEISLMMHGFGDNPNPNPATVVLVETIVLQQMQTILQEATKVAEMRNNRIVQPEDIIFLGRRNLVKLKRMVNYLVKLNQVREKNFMLNPEKVIYNEDGVPLSKKMKNVTDFVASLNEYCDSKNIDFDERLYIRKLRAAKLSEAMTWEKYEAYQKARQASFRSSLYNSSQARFKQWINPNGEFKFTLQTLDILSYLAYETVAEIVDLTFLVRQDAHKSANDPFSKLEGGNFCNASLLSNAVYIKTGQEGITPITVAEIREVLRRFTAQQIGIRGLGFRNMHDEVPLRFFALH